MSLLNDLTSSIPGIDEAMCLGYIMKIVNQLDFSCVVFDTAPTGHTLRLLNFPNILGKGLEKMVALKTKFGGIVQSVGSLMNQNLDQNFEKLFNSLDSLKSNIEVINTQFKDNVRIKTNFKSHFICI
jgi:arsenite-transporting ATPase